MSSNALRAESFPDPERPVMIMSERSSSTLCAGVFFFFRGPSAGLRTFLDGMCPAYHCQAPGGMRMTFSVQKATRRRQLGSGSFNQLHLAIPLAVQHLHLPLMVAEDEDLTVTKLRFFHRLLQGHGTDGYRISGTDDVWLRYGDPGRKRMHGYWNALAGMSISIGFSRGLGWNGLFCC